MTQESFLTRLQATQLPPWERLPDFGLYMDQIVTYTEKCFLGLAMQEQRIMTPAMINNYVKVGLVERPIGKKYTRDSLGQLLMICLLKSAVSMDALKKLLHPASGASTQALYEAFRQTQQRIAESFTAQETLPDPLTCALEASSYQFLCQMLLHEGDDAR